MTKVSVVVPCRNERGQIERFVRNLLTQDLEDLECEFLIADGLSTDHTRGILEAYAARDARLKVIDNPERIVSSGLNRAIRSANGDVVIRMDVHTQYARDYVKCCVNELLRTGAANVGGAWRARAYTTAGRAFSAAHESKFSAGARCRSAEYEGPVDSVYLGCWHKRTLETVGYFDEELVRNQDDELNFRLLRAGGIIWQSRAIVCWYEPRTQFVQLFRQYFQYGFWKVAVIKKHHMPASWRHLVPSAFVLVIIGCAVLGIVANVAIKVLIVVLALYAAASLIASFRCTRSHGWHILPYMPFLFVTYHIAYGVGFLAGLVLASTSRASRMRITTCLTR